jgi:hypothetical protein
MMKVQKSTTVKSITSAIFLAAVFLFLSGSMSARANTTNDLLLPGQVIQGHSKYEGDCNKCHKPYDKPAQTGLCKDCHKEIAKDIEEKQRFHGLMKQGLECKECHTEHKGRDALISKINTNNFDHATTGYILKGGHLNPKVLCKDCHSPIKKYRQAPVKCFGCHERHDKHKGSLGQECVNCHEEKDWKTTHFDHSKTHFPLTGKHIDAKCKDCHLKEPYKDTPMLCIACHKKVDKHKGTFGTKCEDCHTDRQWKEITFDHDRKTKYPLLGKHRVTKCVSCHKGDLYKDKLKTDCNSCHQKDDKHKGKFGPKCESCHIERSWKEIPFDHDKKTKFPLTGKHKDVKCSDCHKGDLYKDKLQMDCLSCHKKDDKHKGNFGAKCDECHVDRSWKEILFDHDKKTKYPLLGKHRVTKCVSCHKGDLYKEKLKTNCFSCHEKDDKHKGEEGNKCGTCHHEDSWKKVEFDHRISRFPLTGKHMVTECKKCHATVVFKEAKSDCYSCHKKEDVHKRTQGNGCEICHNTRDWKSWDFDHDKTHFKLTGKHSKIKCIECHFTPVNKKIALAPTCFTCHEKDDKHDGAFGQQCDRCHIGSSWTKISVGGQRWTN